MKVKRYQKKFNYSYAFGRYPVIELLKHHRSSVIKILRKSVVDGGEEGVREVEELCRELGVRVEVADRAIERIAFKENTYVVGVFDKYECSLDSEENHLVLVEPRNMGNLGTVIRTMLGVNYMIMYGITEST